MKLTKHFGNEIAFLLSKPMYKKKKKTMYMMLKKFHLNTLLSKPCSYKVFLFVFSWI